MVTKSIIPGGKTRPKHHSSQLLGTISGLAAGLTAKLRLNGGDYRLYKKVVLPVPDGSVRIDLVIVSPYGVFMCEKMHMKGRIFGGRNEKTWIQQINESKRTFQSPLPQNYGHAALLAAKLGLDTGKVFPVLEFVGSSFATEMPPHVTHAGGYVRYVKSKTIPVLTKADVARLNERLASGLDPAGQTNGQNAKRSGKASGGKAKAQTCPSCGSAMVLRAASKGAQAGKKFWVCSGYPKCKSVIAAGARPTRAPDFGPPKLT